MFYYSKMILFSPLQERGHQPLGRFRERIYQLHPLSDIGWGLTDTAAGEFEPTKVMLIDLRCMKAVESHHRSLSYAGIVKGYR